MAQKKTTSKNNTTDSKPKQASSGSRRSTRSATPPPPPPPEPADDRRPAQRIAGGMIFLCLAGFTVISHYNTDGAFIAFFANLIKGLIGWGFYLAAPAFVLSAILLFLNRDKIVGYRVCSALLLPVLGSAMAEMLLNKHLTKEFDLKLVTGDLFTTGQQLKSGGVVSGLIANGLEAAFGLYGGLPILLIAFAVLLILALRGNFSGLFKRPNKRERRADLLEEPILEPAEVDWKPEATTRRAEKRADLVQRIDRPRYVTDLPLGDDEDILPLTGPSATAIEEERAAETKGPKVTRVRRKETAPEPAPAPKPAPVQSAPLPNEEVVEGFRKLATPSRAAVKPVTLTTEINDPPKKKLKREELDAEAKAVAEAVSLAPDAGDYVFPPLSLLRSGSNTAVDARDEIAVNKERLEGAIRSFGINAGIVGVIRGPTVTRYDIELEQGVKLSRVTNLAGDLALALGVVNVRIAPIPDRISTVGIEVPNKIVSTVYLRDILESPRFSGAKSKISFALGKDISGDCIVGNIAKLPHMLIAGTTGSGKSVCMNSLILSLLYKARPDEVRLIMIDPKMVELGVYNGIPHLYVPVVTDPKKAAGALQWSVVEMLKRYRLFSEVGVRDLENYNRHCASSGEPTLPQVVIVIDELADLMLVASKEVEESICRVAQMGRAAGMHLVIATQRPSADVITGLMKANIPSRIAFAVSSAMESRIILDQSGAEKLVGMGDMLYSPVGIGKPMRIQGSYVSDEEREDVIQFIKENAGETKQNQEILDAMNKASEDKSSGSSGKGSEEDEALGSYDEMLPQAVEAVLEAGSCSVSMLQRRVKLGYSRAARIVDQMEELGVVGPYEGAKPRQVVVDRAGWHDIQVQLGLIQDDDMALAAEMSEYNDEE